MWLWQRVLTAAAAGLTLIVWLQAGSFTASQAAPHPTATPKHAHLPLGATEVPIENIEGIVLAQVTVFGPAGVDTTGLLVVDTGAGFLALDTPLAARLGLMESGASPRDLSLITTALPRMELGGTQFDGLSPILLFNAEVIRRASGREVMGLAGQEVFAGRAVWIDYRRGRLGFVVSPHVGGAAAPSEIDSLELSAADSSTVAAREASRAARITQSRLLLEPVLGPAARAIPFRLAGDRKILVRGRLRESRTAAPSAWMEWVFDTGATKSVLFEAALARNHAESAHWKSIEGLIAPTLTGNSPARITLAPMFELEAVDSARSLRRDNVDCAVINSDLEAALSSAIGAPVAGLIGYSFFKDDRIAIDYPNRILWLDPNPQFRRGITGTHPFEYSHPGLQLERDGESIRVLGVAVGSPAERAGIAVGDTLMFVGSTRARPAELGSVSRMLEGPAGTVVQVTLRHEARIRVYRLVRRRLL